MTLSDQTVNMVKATEKISLRLTPELKAEIAAEAETESRTTSNMMILLLKEALEARKRDRQEHK